MKKLSFRLMLLVLCMALTAPLVAIEYPPNEPPPCEEICCPSAAFNVSCEWYGETKTCWYFYQHSGCL